MLLGRLQARPDLLRPGDKVLYWNDFSECHIPLEIKKVAPKRLMLTLYDSKKEQEVDRWIPYDRVFAIPQFIGASAPDRLVAIESQWKSIVHEKPESGYYTIGAGIRCVLAGRYWILTPGSDREGQYEDTVPLIIEMLQDIGATEIVFDSGELN